MLTRGFSSACVAQFGAPLCANHVRSFDPDTASIAPAQPWHFSPSPRPRSRWPGRFGWHARVSQRWRSPAPSYAWRCCWLRRLTGRLTSHSEILAAVRPRRCGKASPDQPVAVGRLDRHPITRFAPQEQPSACRSNPRFASRGCTAVAVGPPRHNMAARRPSKPADGGRRRDVRRSEPPDDRS